MSAFNRSRRNESRQRHGVIVDRETLVFVAIGEGKRTPMGIGKTPMKIHV
jgi:hypothetical protein